MRSALAHLSLSGDQARVTLRLANQSGVPARVAAWPAKITESDFQVQPYRGSELDDTVPRPGTVVSGPEAVEIGSVRRPGRLATSTNWAWIYFDLVAEDRRIHLQAFVNVDHSRVLGASVGLLDLDASHHAPMPAGETGSVTIEGDVVTFTVTADALKLVNTADDQTHKVAEGVPVKWIEASTYVSHSLSRLSIRVGRDGRYHEYTRPDGKHGLSEIRMTRHGVSGATSRFVGYFLQRGDEDEAISGHADLNPVDGAIHGRGLSSSRESTSIITPDGVALCYGLSGQTLGRADQLYAYATPAYTAWLGSLIDADARWRDVPFSRLVLAAAHDCGMAVYPLDPDLLELIQSGSLGDALGHHIATHIGLPVVHTLLRGLEAVKLNPSRSILGIANTQRDDTATLLKLGVRFFDMRPGYCFADVIRLRKGTIRHQHALVPGQAYIEFLAQILAFLVEHTREVVVVELKSDGFVLLKPTERDGKVTALSMVPTPEELATCLATARAQVPGSDVIGIGRALDMDKSIGELLESGARLVLIDRVHEPDSWSRLDSYDHQAYNTETPAPIIAMLDRTLAQGAQADPEASPDRPRRGAIYQCQATPTSAVKDDVLNVITYSDCSSLLVYMRPKMDRAIYPWIAGARFEDPGLVVLLNDFCDGVLVEHAIAKSWQRSGLA